MSIFFLSLCMNILFEISLLKHKIFFFRVAGHPLAQNERCLHMFLQEQNIDKNYVPGKIRNTWKNSVLFQVVSFKSNCFPSSVRFVTLHWFHVLYKLRNWNEIFLYALLQLSDSGSYYWMFCYLTAASFLCFSQIVMFFLHK